MNDIMTATNPAALEEDVSGCEKMIGFALPTSYRQFLITCNGGKPKKKFFSVDNWEGGKTIINDIWGIVPGKFNDLLSNVELFAGRFPHGFISIGRDPGGNQILLSLDGTTRGNVYFWDHEDEPEEESDNLRDYPNIYFLSDDFEKFIRNLKDEDEL